MAAVKVVLDTSVLVKAITRGKCPALWILENKALKIYTNKYAIKEVRRTLRDEFSFTPSEINAAVDHIERRCTVLPAPEKEEFLNIKIRDKSDRPIVHTARKLNAVLLIDDEVTHKDAKRYVETNNSAEFFYTHF